MLVRWYGRSPPCCPFNVSCTIGRDGKISMSLSARSDIEWLFRFGEEGNGRPMMSEMRKANPNYVRMSCRRQIRRVGFLAPAVAPLCVVVGPYYSKVLRQPCGAGLV